MTRRRRRGRRAMTGNPQPNDDSPPRRSSLSTGAEDDARARARRREPRTTRRAETDRRLSISARADVSYTRRRSEHPRGEPLISTQLAKIRRAQIAVSHRRRGCANRRGPGLTRARARSGRYGRRASVIARGDVRVGPLRALRRVSRGERLPRAHLLQRGRVLAVPGGGASDGVRVRTPDVGMGARPSRVRAPRDVRRAVQARGDPRRRHHPRVGVVAARAPGARRRGCRRPHPSPRAPLVRQRPRGRAVGALLLPRVLVQLLLRGTHLL